MPKSKYKKRADGRYCVQIRCGFHDDGRPRIKSIYGRTVVELERNVASFKTEFKKTGVVNTPKITLGEWSDQWLKTYQLGKNINTYRAYMNSVNYIKKSPAALKQLSKITLADLNETVKKIESEGHGRTAEYVKMTLIQIFNAAMDNDLVMRNVAEKITLKGYTPKQKRTLTELEENAILNADLSLRDRCFVYLCLFAGLRRGEALALKCRGNDSDIDLKHGCLHVRHNLIFNENTGVISPTPKSIAGIRTIRIIEPLKSTLSEYINSIGSQEYLFMTKSGNIATKQLFRYMWNAIIKEINIEAATEDDPHPINGLTSHILRHTFATYLAAVGMHPKEAQSLLGHSSIAMTMDVYTHLGYASRYADSKIFNYYKSFVSQKSVKRKVKRFSLAKYN